MKIEYLFGQISEQQEIFSAGLDEVLVRQTVISYEKQLTPDEGNGPSFDYFITANNLPQLDILLRLHQDSFHLKFEHIWVHLESATYANEFEEWMEGCLEFIEGLFSNPFKTRTYRVLFFGPKTGAICINQAAWSGDLLACLGLGNEEIWDWNSSEPTTNKQ